MHIKSQRDTTNHIPPEGIVVHSSSIWMGGEHPHLSGVYCILADNPSPMTLNGTNTWLLHEAGSTQALIVDPGPRLPAHHAAVIDAVRSRDISNVTIILTHGHLDHSEGAGDLGQALKAPVHALDRRVSGTSDGVYDGQVFISGSQEWRVITTPGHSSDSCSLVDVNLGAMLTGDTVLGHGTSVVAHPDGRLGDYLHSLERIARLCDEFDINQLLPGHGPARTDLTSWVAFYQKHRQDRLDSVRQAITYGARTASQVRAHAYPDIPDVLAPAAELSIQAQLTFLAELGELSPN